MTTTLLNARPEQAPKPLAQVDELVVNWHVTEACNYRCQYCYSEWERLQQTRDVIRDAQRSNALVQTLWEFFRPENTHNPLRQAMDWRHLRLSLAGGEAMLYPQQVLAVARQARALGMRVSLITNGSLLPDDPAELAALGGVLDMIGLSLDSFDTARNQAIGRADRQGRTLDLDTLLHKLSLLRAQQPALQVKVNTVVNACNAWEDLRAPLSAIRPDRWKVLRVLPVVTDALSIDAVTFARFVARHQGMPFATSVEDNQDMERSYLMVDPQGRFFQNGSGQAGVYHYSQPLTPHNVHREFLRMPFLAERFVGRYAGLSPRAT